MTYLYQDRYRIASARLASWDYSWQAMYFVTICTWQRTHFLGSIENGRMNRSDQGRIAEEAWVKTPDIRPDMRIELDTFCVMPNHMHAILSIGANTYNDDGNGLSNSTVQQGFGPQRKNLASIIRGYKSAVTSQVRGLDLAFAWQTRYHDHIIRDQAEFHRIQEYILTNPLRWQEDEWYSES